MFTNTLKLLEYFLELGVPGYDIMIMKGGECILRRTAGYTDLENKTEVKGDELYNMYSCSKVVTCTAALMLYERGLFKLDDRLADYFPEYENMTVKTEDGLRPATRPILIEDLFKMTAGFHYNERCAPLLDLRRDTEGRCPTREFARYLAREPLCFEPGTRWRYSMCHDVLAAFAEHIAGERFGDFARKNIFEPLGMKNTSYCVSPEERGKIAAQYIFDHKAKKLVRRDNDTIYNFGPDFDSGGAGCVSTVEDFMRFAEGLRTYKLISPDTVRLMSTDRIDSVREDFTLNDYGYGYGLGVRCRRGDGDRYAEGVYDFGWSGAAGAHFSVDTTNGISVMYAQHVLNYPNHEAKKRLVRVITEDILSAN